LKRNFKSYIMGTTNLCDFMNTIELVSQRLSEKSFNWISYCIEIIESFNKHNENSFKFINDDQITIPKSFSSAVYSLLLLSWNHFYSIFRKIETTNDCFVLDEPDKYFACIRLSISCLDLIRLLSRDVRAVELFDNETTLLLIQQIANLAAISDEDLRKENVKFILEFNLSSLQKLRSDYKLSNTLNFQVKELRESRDLLSVHALKCMSNILFNSKRAKDYYSNSDAAEHITIYLKQFNTSSFLREFNIYSANNCDNIHANIMMFNLRILFLLTVFNSELRSKLKEKLQVITYLIEIMDQIMKERLNVSEVDLINSLVLEDNASRLNAKNTFTSSSLQTIEFGNSEEADYCFLKRIDIECIIEILKVLYNLSIDIPNVKASAAQMLNSINVSVITQHQVTWANARGASIQKSHSEMMEEEEAHLMHLVSILRDLLTCKEEQQKSSLTSSLQSKLNDLHSNIINLLTNMPAICFEELLTPCLTTNIPYQHQLITQQDQRMHTQNYDTESKQFKVTNLSIRMALNKKRISRRSRRIKNKPNEGNPAPSLIYKPQTATFLEDLLLIDNDDDMEFEGKNMEAVTMILLFMNRRVTIYANRRSDSNADQLYPVLLLLSLMAKSNKTIRHYCRLKILPPLNEYDLLKMPQNGETIRNKLVALMTDVNLQLKRLSAQFLFILCKENISRLIKYTGYGNAAGLLAESGLMLGKNGDTNAYSSDSDIDSDSEDYKRLVDQINPIKGCIDQGKEDPVLGMSEEQKEYEAVKLVSQINALMDKQIIKPARIGPDGRPVAIEHVLELQKNASKDKIMEEL
jgi:hypothetical protein